MYPSVRYLPAGDRCLIVEFGNEISVAVNQKVRAMAAAVTAARLPGVVEVVPTYRSLSVYYDPLCLGSEELVAKLTALEEGLASFAPAPPRIIEIPTVYGGEFGPDLPFVAQHTGLSESEVIRLHTEPAYLIYMLGFTPGFPYLGGMSERIAAPRLPTPREKIPAGSVGIAGSQTGIYPIESPGGWRIIGRTPVPIYDPQREPPVILQAGDYLRFRAIEEREYREIARQVAAGTFQVRVSTMQESDGSGSV